MRRPHLHRAVLSKRTTSIYVDCVLDYITGGACAANPQTRERAHGGIVATDYCSCGAKRQSEHNNGFANYGPWEDFEDD